MEIANQENEFIDLNTFRQFLFPAIVPIDDLKDKDGEPLAKILVFWRKKNLVPFIPSGKHTFDVSFSDIIWFRILDIMRTFSFPVEKMKLVCDYFFKDAYFDDLPKKNFLYHKDQLSKKKLAGTISKEESETLNFVESNLQDERFLYALKFQVNYLTNLILDAVGAREDKGILIFSDGAVGEQHGDFYYSHRQEHVDPTKPHLFISIKHLLSEFVSSDELAQLYVPQVLNEDEKEVWRAIKDKRIKEITITTSDGSIKTVEARKGQILSGQDAAAVMSFLGLKNYEQLTVKTIDQKNLYVETKSRIIRH